MTRRMSFLVLCLAILSAGLLPFTPTKGQQVHAYNGQFAPHTFGFPLIDPYKTFFDHSRDSNACVVVYSAPGSNQCELIDIWQPYAPYVTYCGLPYTIAGLASPCTTAVMISNPTSTTSYRLNAFDIYVGDHYQANLNFPGLTVPQTMALAGTNRHGGEVAILPPGAFALQSGLGEFGWYMVDDSLLGMYKRSVTCGIANTGPAGGGFLHSGAMIYAGRAQTPAFQKYSVVIATDSVNLNPVRMITLKRASGGHLTLSKVGECSAGILLADVEQSRLMLLDHGLTQVIWAKHIGPHGLNSVPVEVAGNVLHTQVIHYTFDTVPYPPFILSRLHWGHVGLDMQTGNFIYGKFLRSYYAQFTSELNVIMQPFVSPDQQLREMTFFTDDTHGEWRELSVDSTGFISCTPEYFTPVIQDDTIVLDVVTGWTVDNIGVGALGLRTLIPTSYGAVTQKTLECDCDPQDTIQATPTSLFTYQFSWIPGYSCPFQWNFGDGTTAATSTPTHTFPGQGVYLVSVCYDFGCGLRCDTLSLNVSCSQAMATFTQSANFLNVNFNSAGSTGSLLWDFGDGTFSTVANPSHAYATPGTYTVCLVAADSCGADTVCQTITVNCQMAVANISYFAFTLTANFFSPGSVGSLLWDFGDGTTSTVANPNHTYAAAGTYTVCLIATNSCGADTACQTVTLICPMPTAVFTESSNYLAANFNSAGSSGSLLWDFGDGTTSTVANPSHAYAVAGTYTVCLIATNNCGADTFCQTVTVTCPLPTAIFTGTSNLLVANFNSTGSSGSLTWDFGDGSTSAATNPTHTYAVPGTYFICLVASNNCGSDSLCQSINVVCPLPVAAFNFTSTNLTYQFQNLSSFVTNAQSTWDFGDGYSSSQMSPTHTYQTSGNYQVCLTIMDDCGVDTLCQGLSVLERAQGGGVEVLIFPQPAGDIVKLKMLGVESHDIAMLVFSVDGKELEVPFTLGSAPGEWVFETRSLASGMYFLELRAGGDFIMKRFVVER